VALVTNIRYVLAASVMESKAMPKTMTGAGELRVRQVREEIAMVAVDKTNKLARNMSMKTSAIAPTMAWMRPPRKPSIALLIVS